MDDLTPEQILAEFDRQSKKHAAFTSEMEGLVKKVLVTEGVPFHSVTSRPKDRDSFVKKVNRVDKAYSRLDQITDLAGIRVITYFEDDVKRVAEVIEREFDKDSANSADKGLALAPDRFGYRSIHYVVSLPESRTSLTELRPFVGMKAEIQMRSILQHAWAEIEHDLGYKSEFEVPVPIRRKFAQIAGLLEIADERFNDVKSQDDAYEREVVAKIATAPKSVIIDPASINALIASSDLVKRLDLRIAEEVNVEVIQSANVVALFSSLLLPYVGIRNISDLEKSLLEQEENLLHFARIYLGPESSIPAGSSVLQLVYMRLGVAHSDSEILGILESVRMFPPNIGRNVARRIRSATNIISLDTML